jgi:hypothetical protein
MNKKERPTLENLVQENTTKIERFQNETLRPVIKMQHKIIMLFFKNCLLNRKIRVAELSEKERLKTINNFFGKDVKFKNQLLGLIIGHFSEEEFQFYLQSHSEINRRIIQITTQRLRDSIQDFIN